MVKASKSSSSASTTFPSSSSSPTAHHNNNNNTPTLLVTSPTDADVMMHSAAEPLSTTSPVPYSTASTAPASGSTSRTVFGSKVEPLSTKPVITTPTERPSNSPQSGPSNEACEACIADRPYVSHIRSPSHILLALRLLFTDPQKRRQLITNWIHVPLGITSLLFLVWLIKQAMDRAPFRFPSPVLAMMLLFVILLLLDWLSTRSIFVTKLRKNGGKGEKKVLLQPMSSLLEAPCDFCLRYMSVMFTPSFILIPARELINGKEIGLITGWFAASQLLALIFPVVLHKLIRYVVAKVKGRKGRREEKVTKAAEQRRASVATLVAVMSNINGDPSSTRRGTEGIKKELLGGENLGSIATGLSGMTAIATAPLTISTSHIRNQSSSKRQDDAQRQLEHVQLETARQQGDPYARSHSPVAEHHHHYPLTPASPGSPRPTLGLHHNHRLHQQSSYFTRANESERLGRSPSLARTFASRAASSLSPSRVARRRPGSGGNTNTLEEGSATVDPSYNRAAAMLVGGGSRLKNLALPNGKRPQSAGSHPNRRESPTQEQRDASLSPTFDEYIFQARKDLIEKRRGSNGQSVVDPHNQRSSEEGVAEETLVMPTLVPPTPTRTSHEDEAKIKGKFEGDGIRRPSKADSEMTMSNDISPIPNSTSGDVESEKAASKDSSAVAAVNSPNEEEEMDAVDRLVEKLWNSIPTFIFTLILIAGIPIFYLLNISLPLFLSINLLTFLASITLVPAKIRRYAHPILTTSVATVFILWAFGAIRGWSLKRTLNSYSVDAKYTVLWSLSGYNGPVIGAGDVLFSTLDAGIVSLAIPMYRYRWDLWYHLNDMLVVLFPCSMLSLFVWPTVASAIGIAPERALAFASRFMSTPLAIELSLTIGADESITVVLVVITGILISIFKDPFFRLFGLNPNLDVPDKEDQQGNSKGQDYLTIGIAMGSTAGAIGASSLISKPRCMAIASLSFVLFGAILLIFAAIPPIVDTLRSLAGAPLEFVPAS